MSNNILAQMVHGVKKSAFPKALQLDESTDVACVSQLLIFVCYAKKPEQNLSWKKNFCSVRVSKPQQLRESSWIR